jgi:hypothetical protein
MPVTSTMSSSERAETKCRSLPDTMAIVGNQSSFFISGMVVPTMHTCSGRDCGSTIRDRPSQDVVGDALLLLFFKTL